MPKLVRDVDRLNGPTTLRAYGAAVASAACVCVCVFRSVRGGGGGGGRGGRVWASGDRFLRLISFLSQARAPLLQQLRAEYIKERSPFVTVSFRLYTSNELARNWYQIYIYIFL